MRLMSAGFQPSPVGSVKCVPLAIGLEPFALGLGPIAAPPSMALSENGVNPIGDRHCKAT